MNNAFVRMSPSIARMARSLYEEWKLLVSVDILVVCAVYILREFCREKELDSTNVYRSISSSMAARELGFDA